MAAQFSTVRRDHIEYSLWLTFDIHGGVKMTRGRPSITRHERAMQISCTLPKALFQQPELKATIRVPSDVGEPSFDLDMEAVREALHGALGVDLDIVTRVLPEPQP